MSQPFHDGELAVQKRAGVSETASRVGGSIHPAIPPVAAEFLAARTWVVVATVDDDVRPWASLLSGLPGFIEAVGAGTVRIRAEPAPGDPLGRNLRTGAPRAGALDLGTRRRMSAAGSTQHRRSHPASCGPGLRQLFWK
jgi:predicted pyridoxine 5'-phosphate oxidase superfamily flavin-nucleotide-binding protein